MNDEPTTEQSADVETPCKRGFAVMDRERVRVIASVGGRAAQATGRAHKFTSEEARSAGKKGGEARARRRKLERCET